MEAGRQKGALSAEDRAAIAIDQLHLAERLLAAGQTARAFEAIKAADEIITSLAIEQAADGPQN